MDTAPDYEYYGLMADTWDLFRGDTSNWEDRHFFLDAVGRFGQPALDVGCGTGRILLDFLALGIDIDGVDNSPEMLALCRSKAAAAGLAPTLYRQSMTELDLPRRYATLLVPSSSFQLLLAPADARAAMDAFVRHLEPGGALVMPFMSLWQPGDPLERAWDKTAEKVRPADGATIRRWSRTWYEPDAQLEHSEDRYEVVIGGDIVHSESHVRSPAVRGYRQEQAVALYAAAGLSEVAAYAGFSWQPAQPGDHVVTVIGRQPSSP